MKAPASSAKPRFVHALRAAAPNRNAASSRIIGSCPGSSAMQAVRKASPSMHRASKPRGAYGGARDGRTLATRPALSLNPSIGLQ